MCGENALRKKYDNHWFLLQQSSDLFVKVGVYLLNLVEYVVFALSLCLGLQCGNTPFVR